jgi:hypothetical protein
LVERNLAKVEVESSRLFSRSSSRWFSDHPDPEAVRSPVKIAGIAQLVERNLAKVEVESSRLFSRSKFEKGKPRLPFFVAHVAANGCAGARYDA